MRIKKNIFAFLIAHISCLHLLAGCTKSQSSNKDTISIDIEQLKLGKINSTTDFEHIFTIKNTSQLTVVIDHIGTECNCVSITPSSNIPIQPEQEINIKAIIDTSKYSMESLNDESEISTKMLINYHIAENTKEIFSKEIVFTGHVVSNIISQPNAIKFGNITENSKNLMEYINISGSKNVTSIYGECNDNFFTIKINNDNNDGTKGKWKGQVILDNSKIDFGQFNSTLTLYAFGNNGKCTEKKHISIHGFKCKEIIASPPHIFFTDLNSKIGSTEQIRLKSLSNIPYTIVSCESNNNNIKASIDNANKIVTAISTGDPKTYKDAHLIITVALDNKNAVKLTVRIN